MAGRVHSDLTATVTSPRRMLQPITGYHLDEERHWVAELACGHGQHMRHDPPWQVREWVTTSEGRHRFLGTMLDCVRCDRGEPPTLASVGPRGAGTTKAHGE